MKFKMLLTVVFGCLLSSCNNVSSKIEYTKYYYWSGSSKDVYISNGFLEFTSSKMISDNGGSSSVQHYNYIVKNNQLFVSYYSDETMTQNFNNGHSTENYFVYKYEIGDEYLKKISSYNSVGTTYVHEVFYVTQSFINEFNLKLV